MLFCLFLAVVGGQQLQSSPQTQFSQPASGLLTGQIPQTQTQFGQSSSQQPSQFGQYSQQQSSQYPQQSSQYSQQQSSQYSQQQAGQYSQSSQYPQQSNQYSQSSQYPQQSSQYSQSGQYPQQSSQYSQSGQYPQQSNQNSQSGQSSQYSQAGQYPQQSNQYSQQSGQYSQSNQYPQQGQYSQQSGQYPQQGQYSQQQSGQSQQYSQPQVDSQVQTVLNAWTSFNAPPLENTTYEVARQLPSLAYALQTVAPGVQPVGKIEHRIIQGPGGQLLMRFYFPQGRGPFPVVVYYHGGGFVIADLNTYDASCRALTNAANVIVVSVAYRQAPEHPFPAAPDDAYAAYVWVQNNAASFGGNPNKVAIAGESAGGNLAAGVTIKARNQGIKLPVMQLLIYPVTDFNNTNYTSYAQFVNAKPLSTPQLSWFSNYYLGASTDKTDYRVSPLYAKNLNGLPPAFIITADIDPLRDQVEAYRAKLQQAGVLTGGGIYYGVPHEFFGLSAVSDTAKRAVSDAASALNRAFAS